MYMHTYYITIIMVKKKLSICGGKEGVDGKRLEGRVDLGEIRGREKM